MKGILHIWGHVTGTATVHVLSSETNPSVPNVDACNKAFQM